MLSSLNMLSQLHWLRLTECFKGGSRLGGFKLHTALIPSNYRDRADLDKCHLTLPGRAVTSREVLLFRFTRSFPHLHRLLFWIFHTDNGNRVG
jgi:hypothetical protein